MNIDIQEILSEVGESVFRRGIRYMLEERVTFIRLEEDWIEAVVKGTRPYHVSIREEGGERVATCDCPYQSTCKHIVAVLLMARKQFRKAPVRSEGPTEAPWIAYFAHMIPPHQRETTETRPLTWRVGYLLRLDSRGWFLLPGKVYVKQDGTWGRFIPVNRLDPKGSSIQFAPNDPILVRFLAEASVGHQDASWYEPVQPPLAYGTCLGDLFLLLKDSLLLLHTEEGGHETLMVSSSQARLIYRLIEEKEAWRIAITLETDEMSRPVNEGVYLLTQNPVWILIDRILYRVKNTAWADLALSATRRVPPPIPKASFGRFIEEVYPWLVEREPIPLPPTLPVEEWREITARKLVFDERGNRLILRFVVGYRGIDVAVQDPRSVFFKTEEGRILMIRRDREAEEAILARLVETGLKRFSDGTLRLVGAKALTWMFTHLDRLEQEGFELVDRERLHRFRVRTGEAEVRLGVHSGIDWFDLQLDITIDGVKLPLESLKKSIQRETRFVQLADGSLGRLSEDWFERLATLFHFGEVKKGTARVSRSHATLVDLLFQEAMERRRDAVFDETVRRLRNFKGIRKHRVPVHFQGTLRPYQKAGLDWLLFLNAYGFGGCLADDMGLGKTVQALALLAKEKERGEKGPSLIVCPTSVLFNWQEEIRRFAPHLTFMAHVGLDRNLDPFLDEGPDLILTTYGILLRDITLLREVPFHYVILDESQKIKNPDSQTAKAACLLQARHRLVLTGTPVENNTVELWSQFAFLNPGLLGPLSQFRRLFTLPIEKHRESHPAELLRTLIRPFILRRTKEDVEKELPPKCEQILLCPMNPAQAGLYQMWRDHYRVLLLSEIEKGGLEKARMHILAGLTRLRQIACHPRLIDPTHAEDSGKFETLKEFIEEVLTEHHKILVFSQFVRMLRLIRAWCDEAGYPYAYLDGSTENRQGVVHRFQSDEEVRLFLISLRAGGTGLNLTAADYVIHVDPWWNPAVEAQATDRAHRIGQERPVFVYRFITEGTVEEKMLELQRRKKTLVEALVQADRTFSKHLTKEDVELLLS